MYIFGATHISENWSGSSEKKRDVFDSKGNSTKTQWLMGCFGDIIEKIKGYLYYSY